jgi:hypothetical protein
MPIEIREWRREHDDGSYGVVERHESGVFIGIDVVLVDDNGTRRGHLDRAFPTREEACAAMDARADRRGHRCGERCGRWLGVSQ